MNLEIFLLVCTSRSRAPAVTCVAQHSALERLPIFATRVAVLGNLVELLALVRSVAQLIRALFRALGQGLFPLQSSPALVLLVAGGAQRTAHKRVPILPSRAPARLNLKVLPASLGLFAVLV